MQQLCCVVLDRRGFEEVRVHSAMKLDGMVCNERSVLGAAQHLVPDEFVGLFHDPGEVRCIHVADVGPEEGFEGHRIERGQRVVVGVRIDDPGHRHEAIRVDFANTAVGDAGHRDDATAVDRDVCSTTG